MKYKINSHRNWSTSIAMPILVLGVLLLGLYLLSPYLPQFLWWITTPITQLMGGK